MNSTGPEIACESVSVKINQVELLRPINHTFTAGGWHGIAGPNGGGKSTLLKTIAGLLPHRGKLSICWQDQHSETGYMPQVAPFDASLPINVSDFLGIATGNKPVWLKEAEHTECQLLERLQVTALLKKRLGTLSMGERQRVLLAIALLKKPSLLLLDEPLAGIDKQGQESMLSVLKEFKQQNGTLIMVEHDFHVLNENCDSLLWINGGLEKSGTPAQVLQQVPEQVVQYA